MLALGDPLAQAVAQRLRADGWEAVAVAAPRGRIDVPKSQDDATRRVTATHVLAHEARLWQGLVRELAAETAEAIEMR